MVLLFSNGQAMMPSTTFGSTGNLGRALSAYESIIQLRSPRRSDRSQDSGIPSSLSRCPEGLSSQASGCYLGQGEGTLLVGGIVYEIDGTTAPERQAAVPHLRGLHALASLHLVLKPSLAANHTWVDSALSPVLASCPPGVTDVAVKAVKGTTLHLDPQALTCLASHLTSLSSLSIRRLQVSAATLSAISRCQRLRQLSLSNLHLQGCSELPLNWSILLHLTQLQLNSISISPPPVPSPNAAGALEGSHQTSPDQPAANREVMSRPPHHAAGSLQAPTTRREGLSLASLKHLPSLKHLVLDDLAVATLEPLSACTSLCTLEANGVSTTIHDSSSWSFIRHLPRLEHLELHECESYNDDLHCLEAAQNLTQLILQPYNEDAKYPLQRSPAQPPTLPRLAILHLTLATELAAVHHLLMSACNLRELMLHGISIPAATTTQQQAAISSLLTKVAQRCATLYRLEYGRNGLALWSQQDPAPACVTQGVLQALLPLGQSTHTPSILTLARLDLDVAGAVSLCEVFPGLKALQLWDMTFHAGSGCWPQLAQLQHLSSLVVDGCYGGVAPPEVMAFMAKATHVKHVSVKVHGWSEAEHRMVGQMQQVLQHDYAMGQQQQQQQQGQASYMRCVSMPSHRARPNTGWPDLL